MPDYAYRPHEEPGWPWRVVPTARYADGRRWAVVQLPEQGTGSHASPHFEFFGAQWVRLYSTYRFDGPTLWPKAWREWLWGKGRCHACKGAPGGCTWCGGMKGWGEWLYLTLDLPGRWLMRRWGDAIAAHDALVQIHESLPGSRKVTTWVLEQEARAFRAYADRQMRLMIRPMPGKKTTGPLSLRWQLDRLLAFTVRWLAYLAVRVNAGWRRVFP